VSVKVGLTFASPDTKRLTDPRGTPGVDGVGQRIFGKPPDVQHLYGVRGFLSLFTVYRSAQERQQIEVIGGVQTTEAGIEYADQGLCLAPDACFLVDFAQHTLSRGLSNLQRPTRHGPPLIIGPLDEQNASPIVDDRRIPAHQGGRA
jgi:hypothetical protein